MSSDDAIDMHTAQSFNMNRDDFLHQLYTFMNKRGQPISKVPSLGYQELDLFMLYKLVIERGGMDEVTRKQEWKIVYQDLGIPTMSTSASYNTRTNYKKYLYLYELEHCDFSDRNRPKDTEPKYQVGEHVRIISSVFEGQVFYAKILKYRYKDGKNQYYVHYNGWNSSHDEWMREDVLDPLLAEERRFPESLPNPPASRSSKSPLTMPRCTAGLLSSWDLLRLPCAAVDFSTCPFAMDDSSIKGPGLAPGPLSIDFFAQMWHNIHYLLTFN